MTDIKKVPSWIEPKIFENVLRKNIPNFKEITDFKASDALPPGENYATYMIKLQFKILLNDQTSLDHNLMMKVPLDTDFYRNEMKKFNMFAIESLMYSEIVPEMEKLYADKGVQVRFTPKAYSLEMQEEYILLEDLKVQGFLNANRQNGLDMEHCKIVLRKLSQWHAATAVRVEQKGPYDEQYVQGIANKAGIDMLRSVLKTNVKNVLRSVQTLENHTIYREQMEKLSNRFIDDLFKESLVNNSDFNVLNHGDCWSNNIMFQYDRKGNVVEIFFVDLQTPRYGNPGQDLLYFILSSAQLNLKLQCFDEMIKFYYDNLKENLMLLNYSKSLPTLGDIHRLLIKAGKWGVFAAWNVLPVILADSRHDSNVENIVGNTEKGQNFQDFLYSGERLKKHYTHILPWLYYRGAFDFE